MNIKLDFDKKFGPVFPPSGHDLLYKMLKFDPSERPTAAECLNFPFFAEFLDKQWIEEQHKLVNQNMDNNVDITDANNNEISVD